MCENDTKLKVLEVLTSLEESGGIVLTNPIPEQVAEKVVKVVESNVLNCLSSEQFRAVLNSLNTVVHNTRLDSNNFQTIIGIEKEELKEILDKLRS